MLMPMLVLAVALQGPTDPTCSAEVLWTTGDQPLTASRSAPWRTLTLFSAVSQPTSRCLPADIRLTASYFDANDDLLCSGIVESAARQTALTQTTTFELRLTNPFEFVRWRSGPRNIALRWLPFECSRPDGTGDVTQGELDRASSVRLYATALPLNGGLATAMVRVTLTP
jgi:hypothetical protein